MRSARPRTCPGRARGLWLKVGGRAPRRLSQAAYRLGDLRDGWASWFETTADGFRLRIARGSADADTVVDGNLDCCALGGGTIDHGHVHWIESPDRETATLGRTRLSTKPLTTCQYLLPVSGLPWESFAVDHGHPFYVGHALSESGFDSDLAFGIYEIPPQRTRWRDC